MNRRIPTPAQFVNRELGQLAFNRRVLAQAADDAVPLLERLRFITIVSSNLDEFFEIRVAGLKESIKLGLHDSGPDARSSAEVFEAVSKEAHALVADQYKLLNETVLPSLAREGIVFPKREEWTGPQKQWIRDYYFRELLPVLTPIGLDPAHPFPRVLNKSLNFAVELEGRDAFGRSSRAAIVQAPRALPRLIRLPQASGLREPDLYRVDGPVTLYRLREVHDQVERPALKYPPFTPGLPPALDAPDLFEVLKKQDVLLHHPYQSFLPVIDFIRTTANDPNVIAIKQTVYRTGTDSELMEILVEAARKGKEVAVVVQQLTGLGRAGRLKHVWQSPFTLHRRLIAAIRNEAKLAAEGKPARIIAKMNALLEPQIIEELYTASGAGVKIELMVRGVCALRPGIEGVSDNIRVRSVVGRFLEHSRVFYFENGGAEDVYLASADWMARNFFRRIELCFPVLDPVLKKRVIREGLQPYLEDNSQAWMMGADGNYERQRPRRAKARSAQEELLLMLATPD